MSATFAKFVLPIVGSNAVRHTTKQEFTLGVAQIGDNNTTWVYVLHTVDLAANAATAVDSSFNTGAGTGYTNGTVAAKANEYGWVKKTTSPL